MKRSVFATTAVAAGALFSIGLSVGCPTSLADPDYSNLPVNPNGITDSTAYIAEAPSPNPDGQPGVTAVFTHRDGSRKITDTILVLPDAAAATAALQGATADVNAKISNAKSQPAPVGTGGTLISGQSADGSQAVTALLFTQDNVATTIRFEGPTADPVPSQLAIDYGQDQDNAIKNAGLL